MNRNQATEKTEIPARRLVQLETGEKQPTLEELKALSKTYKRTIATLLLDKPPKEKPLPADRRTIDSKELGNFHVLFPEAHFFTIHIPSLKALTRLFRLMFTCLAVRHVPKHYFME